MAWNDIQASGNTIAFNDWNIMVSGIQHHNYNYVIYNEGGLTHSKKSDSGDIVYSDTNAASVINHTLADMNNSGGTCFIRTGEYKITETIVISGSWTRLIGDGNMTKLYLDDSVDDDIIKTRNTGTSNLIKVEVADMWLSGNKDNQTAGHGVHVTMYNGYIHDMYIKECKDHGIFHEGGGTSNDDCYFYRNNIINCDGDGIRVFGSTAVPLQNIVNNTIGTIGQCGVRCYGNQEYIAGNQIYTFGEDSSTSPGILLDRASRSTIIGNSVYTHHVDGRGIMLTSKGGLHCFENTITANQLYGTNAANVILVWASGAGTECRNNIIANNTIAHNALTHFGISLSGSAGTCIKNQVIGNNLSGNTLTVKIYDNGSNNIIRLNVGYPDNVWVHISSQAISGGIIKSKQIEAAGIATCVQYHGAAGYLAGDDDFTWNATTNTLDINGAISSQVISGGTLNCAPIMTPTNNEPPKTIGTLWMSGSTSYARLYMISGDTDPVWQQIAFV